MAERGSENPPGGAVPPQGQADQPQGVPAQLALVVQFLKDLSFENPRAPESLGGNQSVPQIQVGVDVQARRRNEEQYEVELHITATAQRENDTTFMVEMVYGGVFVLRNIPEQSLQPVLLIECPRLLFPFARRILADVTRDGGFPPLLLDPIDFTALYRRQMMRQQPGAAEGSPPASA
jgi:preprotein translocase subunit SecB